MADTKRALIGRYLKRSDEELLGMIAPGLSASATLSDVIAGYGGLSVEVIRRWLLETLPSKSKKKICRFYCASRHNANVTTTIDLVAIVLDELKEFVAPDMAPGAKFPLIALAVIVSRRGLDSWCRCDA